MADYDVPAAVEETAKAVQSLSDVAQTFGGFVARVAGTAPESFFGIIDDKLKFVRGKRAVRYYLEAKKLLEDAGLDTSRLAPPSPSIELPLLAAATLEDRDELTSLWTKLLAAATAPDRRNRVRARHIEILSKLEPIDALLLKDAQRVIDQRATQEAQRTQGRGVTYINERETLTHYFKIDMDELDASLNNLKELRLVSIGTLDNIVITGEGRNFISVVSYP